MEPDVQGGSIASQQRPQIDPDDAVVAAKDRAASEAFTAPAGIRARLRRRHACPRQCLEQSRFGVETEHARIAYMTENRDLIIRIFVDLHGRDGSDVLVGKRACQLIRDPVGGETAHLYRSDKRKLDIAVGTDQVLAGKLSMRPYGDRDRVARTDRVNRLRYAVKSQQRLLAREGRPQILVRTL